MGKDRPSKLVLVDSSVLLSFLNIDRVDLLGRLPGYTFLITDHVRGEVLNHYEEQLSRLGAAIREGWLRETRVEAPAEFETFLELFRPRVLGVGECSAIAAAFHRGMALAIDDKGARKAAAKLSAKIQILETKELVYLAIDAGILAVEEADAIKGDWETNHRFKLPFASFRRA
ncbi:MAG: hypothetical protein IPK72_01995 [Candidatus Eisenbacteria bacterium]|nr:hypothetical protein [Candidatus Eisenbacteria bacterium]